MALRTLGEWADSTRPSLPQPDDLVDTSLDEDSREGVACYLEGGMLLATMMGPDACRLCGVNLIGDQVSDGVYIWRRSLAHYVREHAVRLPDQFREHVENYFGDLAESPADHEWWPEAAAEVISDLAR